jgi:hypothetical protein
MKDKEFLDQKLDGYDEIPTEDIDNLMPGTKVRYVTYDPVKKRKLFRFGGVIKLVEKDYLVLIGNNNVTFSVQRNIYDKRGNHVYTTMFFVRKDAIKKNNEYRAELIEKENELDEMEKELNKKEQEIKLLKAKLKAKNTSSSTHHR